jgi:hypothetical protein
MSVFLFLFSKMESSEDTFSFLSLMKAVPHIRC